VPEVAYKRVRDVGGVGASVGGRIGPEGRPGADQSPRPAHEY